MAPDGIAVMNDDIGNFGYNRMQQIVEKPEFMKSTSAKTFKGKFLTCNVFVFYKLNLALLRCKQRCKVQIITKLTA